MVTMNNKTENFITKNRNFIIIILFIIFFISINIIRLSSSNYFPSTQSTIFINNFQEYKSFSYQGTNIFYESIIELSFLFGEKLSIFIVIFTINLVSIILFNRIADIILKRDVEKLIAGVLFILTSMFLLNISTFSFLPAIIMLMIWTIYLSFIKPKLLFIPLIISIFINLNLFIVNIALAIILYIIFHLHQFKEIHHKKITLKKFFVYNVLIPTVVLILVHLYSGIITQDLFLSRISYSNNLLSNNIYSISIIYLILAVFALFTEIKDNKILILSIILLLLSFINIYLGIIFLIWVCVIAAIGLYEIIKRKWFVKELRIPVIFLLILLFLFSAVSFTDTIINSGPSNELIGDINVLQEYKQKNLDKGVVFCNLEDCDIISAYSNASVFYSTKQFINKGQHKEMLNITTTILKNSNLKVMGSFFAENNISIVFISKKTLNKEWSSVDQGMLLLLTQSNQFIMLDNTAESRIFYYIADDNGDEDEDQ